jgi:alkaline phosphatase D
MVKHFFTSVFRLFLLLSLPVGHLQGQSPSIQRVAILACHRQNEPSPALAKYIAAKPDLCLWIGDNIYADSKDNIAFIESCYNTLAAKPDFQTLKTSIPFLATWDDHDFGLNDAGKEYKIKSQSKDLFRKFWGLEQDIPAERDGIYYSKTFGQKDQKLQVIMLDVRYNRDAPDGKGDVLGEAQWKWLEAQLRQPATLRLIVSGFQILLNKEAGSETWDFFPKSRQRLFDLVRKTQAEGVVFLTGDQHYGEVCRLNDALDYDAIELQFAGINQTEDAEPNIYRVSPVALAKHSYALIDIQWESSETDMPHLDFRIFDALNDQVELTYRVNFKELALKLDFPEKPLFVPPFAVDLEPRFPNLQLHYTLDKSNPTFGSKRYQKPIQLTRTTMIKAQYFDPSGFPRSPIYTQQYVRSPAFVGAAPKNVQAGLAYQYFEGSFNRLPHFEALTPLSSGLTKNFDLEQLAKTKDHFALQFEGYFDAPVAGTYLFGLESDDGSQLFLHDQLIVDNDGSHSLRKKTGEVYLKKGLHPLRINYFDDTFGQKLNLEYAVNGGAAIQLKAADLFTDL